MRCNRYPSLDEIYRDKTKAVVSFTDDPELEDLMGEENREKVSFLLDDMFDEEDEDLLVKDDPQMETMLPYYKQIEIESGKTIKNRFKGEVTYSLDTYQQKRFEHAYEGFKFYCFLDGYQEDKDHIRVFEVKATTSKKFMEMTYKDEDGEKKPLFDFSQEGILKLQEDLGEKVNNEYETKIKRLMNRFTKEGRYIYDISYQRYVLEKANKNPIKNVQYYLVVLNSNYIFDGRYNEQNEPIYGDDLVVLIDVTSLTKRMMDTIEHDIEIVIERLNTMNANPVSLGIHCQRKDTRQCMFYPICYKHVPKYDSIFTYLNGHHGFKDENNEKRERFDLLNEGYLSATDIPVEWLNREDNVIQRKVIETHVPYVAKHKIDAGINALIYPIYHLDFETFPCPLPRFKGEKPYTQSLFQYSIHVEHQPGVCDKDSDNHGFIATKHTDLRRELVESMLDVIKQDGGSIMVYNQSFEQTRLKEMAVLFPEHKERLYDMIDRLFDLMHLLKGNQRLYKNLGYSEEEAKGINYYHHALNGSYSIKKVLPIFSPLSYDQLGVKNGVEALVVYARFPIMDEQTFKMKYQELFEYCKQDTWAMVEILEKLRKL
jgi:hypothetical protein